MADSKITGLTADTTPTTDDLVVTVNDPGGTPANKKVTIANLLTASTFPAGSVVQVVSTSTSAVATGTTTVPADDTIPQNTEGDEYMTLAITPKSTTNVLVIEVTAMLSTGTAARTMQFALFQDTTANALAAGSTRQDTVNAFDTVHLVHTMAAGTTSATTFKFRAGVNSSGTTTFNGTGAGRLYGAITKSSMVIWEYKA